MAGAMGRGRLMPNKQNLRVVECKPQPCVVSVEGLSSSTTDAQLKSLLVSVGPIQVGHVAVFVCVRGKVDSLGSVHASHQSFFVLELRFLGNFQVLRNFSRYSFQLNKLSLEILRLPEGSHKHLYIPCFCPAAHACITVEKY